MNVQPPWLEANNTGTTEPGYLILGPRGSVQPVGQVALVYDDEGNLVYKGPEEVAANFRVQQLHGQDVITFWSGTMMDLGFGYGAVYTLDNTHKEIHTCSTTPTHRPTPRFQSLASA